MNYPKAAACILIFSAFAGDVLAKAPSDSAAVSCLAREPRAQGINYAELKSVNSYMQDDYNSGFAAKYMIRITGKDIGYAEKGKRRAIIYDKRLYPINNAVRVLGTRQAPYDFDPFLAFWAIVRDGDDKYMCVTFNFGGLGQSGSFQNVRGAYMLSLGVKPKLFYMSGDIRKYVKN